MKNTVTFLMPTWGNTPIGGYLVVYEYANRLASAGYRVTIVYVDPRSVFRKIKGPGTFMKSVETFFRHKRKKTYLPDSWFTLDAQVRQVYCWNLTERFVPRSDIYFATAAETAVYLNKYKKVGNGNKYYLIQHFEDWNLTADELRETYRYGFHNITISSWLYDIVIKENPDTVLIENGFDFSRFRQDIEPPKRNSYHFALLYHTALFKGTSDGLKALDIVYRKLAPAARDKFRVSMFGTVQPDPGTIPEYVTFYHRPPKEELLRIYNEAAIFVGTSHCEGWGLTVGEAMICGAAVACTDAHGYDEMAIDGKTALISPVADPEALAENLTRLAEDDELRLRLSRVARDFISKFTWDRAAGKMIKLLESNELT